MKVERLLWQRHTKPVEMKLQCTRHKSHRATVRCLSLARPSSDMITRFSPLSTVTQMAQMLTDTLRGGVRQSAFMWSMETRKTTGKTPLILCYIVSHDETRNILSRRIRSDSQRIGLTGCLLCTGNLRDVAKKLHATRCVCNTHACSEDACMCMRVALPCRHLGANVRTWTQAQSHPRHAPHLAFTSAVCADAAVIQPAGAPWQREQRSRGRKWRRRRRRSVNGEEAASCLTQRLPICTHSDSAATAALWRAGDGQLTEEVTYARVSPTRFRARRMRRKRSGGLKQGERVRKERRLGQKGHEARVGGEKRGERGERGKCSLLPHQHLKLSDEEVLLNKVHLPRIAHVYEYTSE